MNTDHGRADLVIVAVASTVDDDIQACGVLIESSVVSRHGNSFSFVVRSRSECRRTVNEFNFGKQLKQIACQVAHKNQKIQKLLKIIEKNKNCAISGKISGLQGRG